MNTVTSPFKFLEPYELRDAHLFFGRELETKVLLADIVTSRLVVLFAKTGTGKTSLINAGVRPVLHERGYRSVYIRVREDPVTSARLAIEDQLGERLPAGKSFGAQLATLAKEQPVVLFFDQFEEFFVYVVRDQPAVARGFVSELARIGASEDVADEGADLHLVFSMREEFLAEMEIFRDDIPTIFGADSNLRLRWFTPSQAVSAINGPLAAAPFNATVEAALVERIVNELTAIGLSIPGTSKENPIEPAQLQIVCDTAWRARHDSRISVDDYAALGRPGRRDSVAEQILDQRLLEEFERLQSERELELLWRLLPELHTARGTKWVRELNELARTVGTDPEALRELLSHVRRSGLVDVVSRQDAEFVELVHDYLAEPRRVEALRRGVRTIVPMRIVRQGTRAFLEGAPGPPADDLAKVLERLDELELTALEGEVVLRWALGDVASDAPRVFTLIERTGADVWGICAERLEQAGEDEVPHVVESLARLERPEAATLLGRTLDAGGTNAAHVVTILGGVATMPSLELLERALERRELRDEAQEALARLAAGWGVPAVAERAVEVLGSALVGEEVSPEVAEALLSLASSRHTAVAARVLPLLANVEQVRAVQALERRLDDAALAADARAALRRLAESTRADVATAAASALGRTPPVERRPEPTGTDEEPWPARDAVSPRAGGAVSSSQLERHLHTIARAIRRSRVIPIVGPGANLVGRRQDAPWMPGHGLPTGIELARHLARDSYYPDGEALDLPRVAQYFALAEGEYPLYRALRSVFAVDHPPTPVHQFLAGVPAALRSQGVSNPYQIILTTNFDDALERAFDAAGEPYDLLVYAAVGESRGSFLHWPPDGRPVVIEQPNQYLGVSPDERTVIVKLHGSVSRADEQLDSYVVTEDDFIDYLGRSELELAVPAQVVSRLRRSHLLFLGQSLRDWTLRAILHRIWSTRDLSFRSWAVVRDPSPVDQRFWQVRDVDVVNAPLDEYIEGLQQVLAQQTA